MIGPVQAELTVGVLPEPSASSRAVARNVLWVWAATAADLAVGFVLAPFLVGRLGATGYGIWLLITSLSSYLLLLDFGVRSSVGRFIALYTAHGDQVRVNRVVSTALAIWCGLAALVLVATVAAEVAFFEIFAVPEAWHAEARTALLLIGAQLALKLPLDVFGAVLYGLQRFDLTHGIQIGHAIARGGLTVLAVRLGLGLPGLALVLLLIQVTAGLAGLLLLFRTNPSLRLRPALVCRADARDLFRFGAWNTVLAVGRLITPALSPALVGALLGIALVTPFSLTTRLIAITVAVLNASASVLTPLAAQLQARAEDNRQQTLFVVAGKYCWLLALSLTTVLTLVGSSFLSLWIAPDLASAATLLTVLAVGELIPFSQHVTSSVILGLARHRRLALLTIVEAASVVALALTLVPPFGLVGMGVAVAIPGLLCRGVIPMLYGCRLLQLPLQRYLVRALLPAVGPALLAGACLTVATSWRTPTTWPELSACVAGYALVLATACLCTPGWSDLRGLLRRSFRAATVRAVREPLSETAP